MHLMTDTPSRKRTDSASRVIPATPQRIYRALAAPEALIAWLPPKGMEGRILEFDARRDGTEVSIVCENVPEGVRKEDHDVGMRSNLKNLAGYLA